MRIKQELQERRHRVDTLIQNHRPANGLRTDRLVDAMMYAVTNGGKRIRPILLSETYRLFEKEETPTVHRFMVALELIHCFSLVHDDLPAMDNDDFRRGKPTTHKVYGEDVGILAGDALLNYAYEVAVSSFALSDLPMERKVAALNILLEMTGHNGMIGGQILDIDEEEKQTAEDFIEIYTGKTAALLEAAMGIGAVLAGADREQLSDALQAAKSLGLAYQIQDDLLDEIGDAEKIGKAVGSDAKNNKKTLGSIYGPEKAREEVRRLSQEALDAVGRLGDNPFLTDLIRYLTERDY